MGKLALEKFERPRKCREKKRAKRRTIKQRKHVTAKRRPVRKITKRETLRRNPTRHYLIEALTLNGNTPRYFYWSDAHQLFTDKRPQASPYASEKAARIEAKKLNTSPRLPKQICCLRVVPQ
jgi:hypothetical protein